MNNIILLLKNQKTNDITCRKIKKKFNILLDKLIYLDNISNINSLKIFYEKLIDICKKKSERSIIKNMCIVIEEIIEILIKNSGINLIINNIPSIIDNEIIDKEHILDTFIYYGEILKVELYKQMALIWFRDNESAKLLLTKCNNMMIDKNIITCKYIEQENIKQYNWTTKTYYYVNKNNICCN